MASQQDAARISPGGIERASHELTMQPETVFLSWGFGGCGGARGKLHLLFFLLQSLSKLTELLRIDPNDQHANVSELHENRKQQRGKTADRKQPCVECYARPHGMALRAV